MVGSETPQNEEKGISLSTVTELVIGRVMFSLTVNRYLMADSVICGLGKLFPLFLDAFLNYQMVL